MDMTSAAEPVAAPPPRGARRRTETRRRLLRAARSVFAREGLENATIAQITHEADVGFGTFYLHFTTKEEAYRAVVTDGFGELAHLLTAARSASLARGEPWWEIVRASVRAYCDFAERNRELFLVMFAGGRIGIGLARELQERFAEQVAGQLIAAPVSARDGDLPAPYPYPAQLVALTTVVALTRAVQWWLAQDDARLTLDAFADDMTRYITAALWGQTPASASRHPGSK